MDPPPTPYRIVELVSSSDEEDASPYVTEEQSAAMEAFSPSADSPSDDPTNDTSIDDIPCAQPNQERPVNHSQADDADVSEAPVALLCPFCSENLSWRADCQRRRVSLNTPVYFRRVFDKLRILADKGTRNQMIIFRHQRVRYDPSAYEMPDPRFDAWGLILSKGRRAFSTKAFYKLYGDKTPKYLKAVRKRLKIK